MIAPEETGIVRLSSAAFPKTCTNCFKVYEDELQFLVETEAIPHTGRNIREVKGELAYDEPEEFIEVYRNCCCGTTMMEYFHSRRNLSQEGIRQRVMFARIQDALIREGYEKEEARTLILDFMTLVISVNSQKE